MRRLTVLVLIMAVTASCAGRDRLVKYGKDLDDIRGQVRTIRQMTDQMRTELNGLQKSVSSMNSNVDRQTSQIKEQQQRQERMKDIVSSIKDAVVKLESEKIPAEKEELAKIKNENADDATPDSGFIVKTEKDGPVTKVYTENLPGAAPLPAKKTVSSNEYNLKNKKAGFGYAVKDGVILWQRPTKDSDVLEILVSWQQLTLLGKLEKDGVTWWKVKTNDFTGYVNSKYIIVSEK